MPWLAVHFVDSTRRRKITNEFEVKGLPTLLVLDKAGNSVVKNAEKDVRSGVNCFKKWKYLVN